jgi:glutamate-1-semialdehyde 2,1-aminomutase
VSSPVRSFSLVGGDPFFVAEGAGAWIRTADGQRLIDYVQSWGASILGHAHPAIVAAVEEAARRGTSFGMPTEGEVRLAEAIAESLPSVEKLRFVSSGTEATMSAIRVARGFTGRDLILKFDGNYHGHADMLLVSAGSGVATLGLAGSAGVPQAAVAHTVVVPYNDLGAVEKVFAERGEEIACVIVEPVAANIGCVPPKPGFLDGIERLCRQVGSLLILDEVITGFRVARGGAQQIYGLTPDITCLGKVIGGGLPLAAFGGRAEVMDVLAPAGPVYQAGTLSGNPIATAAGLAALSEMDDAAYKALEGRAAELQARLEEVFATAGVAAQVQRAETLLGLYFSEAPVTDYAEAKASDTALYRAFFHALLKRGIYVAPSPFEAIMISLAHGPDELERTSDAAAGAIEEALSATAG